MIWVILYLAGVVGMVVVAIAMSDCLRESGDDPAVIVGIVVVTSLLWPVVLACVLVLSTREVLRAHR